MSFHLVLFWLPLSQAVHERKLLLFWLLLLLPPSCALLVSSLCSHPVDCIVYDAAAPGAAPTAVAVALAPAIGYSQQQRQPNAVIVPIETHRCHNCHLQVAAVPFACSPSLSLYASHPTAAAFKFQLIICAFSSFLFVRSV